MISWLRSILHPTTVKLYPGYEDMLPFMQSLPEAFAHGDGLLIHDGRNQLRILEYGSREYVVKSYQVPIFFNRVVYGLFRSSKAERALRNAVRLMQIGIGSPQPVGFVNIRSGLLFTHSYMVTARSACPYRYDMLLSHPFDCLEQVCREVGRCTGLMHEHGMYNMDYSRGNILFDVEPRPLEKDGRFVDVTQEDVQVRLEMVDLNRIRSGRVDISKGCRNFNRLPAHAEMHRWMAEEYARVRGFHFEECYRLIRHYRLQQPEVEGWER